MKFATVATAIAAIAPLASAAGYKAAWTIRGADCSGTISLGEYTPNSGTCTPVDCKPVEDQTAFSTKTTCVDSHITGANEVLSKNNKPYVLVEVYPDDSDCKGNFTAAVAVTADGTCLPSINGKASFNVTWAPTTGTVWKQYTNGKCEGEAVAVPFTKEAADGKTCTASFLVALAVAPSSTSESNSVPSAGPAPTSAPPGGAGLMTAPPSAPPMDYSTNATPLAPTTASGASSMSGIAVSAVFVVTKAALALVVD